MFRISAAVVLLAFGSSIASEPAPAPRKQVPTPATLYVVAEWSAGTPTMPMTLTATVRVDRVAGGHWESAGVVTVPGGIYKMGVFRVANDPMTGWAFSIDGKHGNPTHKRLSGTTSPVLVASDGAVGPGGLARVTVRESP